MFAWHTGLRTRIPAYMCPHTAMYMQVWHSSVYPWAYAASGRGSNLVYMHHTARADTGEGFTGQTRDKKSGGGWGVGLYPFSVHTQARRLVARWGGSGKNEGGTN